MPGTTDWTWLRSEIATAITDYINQLEGLSGSEPIPNLDWTVAELTAHLASLPSIYAKQDDLAEDFEAPTDWAAFSIAQRSHIPTDDLTALADLLRSEISASIERVEDPDQLRWLYGCRTTDRNIAGALLAELTIHGMDLARLTGANRELTSERAAAAIPNTMAIVPAFADPTKARKIAGTYHMGFRGVGDWTFEIDEAGSVAVAPGRPSKADARMSGDPDAFMLVSLGRVNQFVPALKGQMFAYGRKPWRMLALGDIAVPGI